jgi:hypothetical protein
MSARIPNEVFALHIPISNKQGKVINYYFDATVPKCSIDKCALERERHHRGEKNRPGVSLFQKQGRRLGNFAVNVPLLIPSKKVAELFKGENFTGWIPYPVLMFRKDGSEFDEAYVGMGIIGRTGKFAFNKMRKHHLRSEDIQEAMKHWDGSDFFLAENHNAVFVTKRVIGALKNGKISDWEAKLISDEWFA